jgi:hypothetical protein
MVDFATPDFINWLSAHAIAVAGALLVSGLLSIWSARLFGLAPEHKLWAFIVGFAVLCSLATGPVKAAQNWNTALYHYALPLLIAFIYFLPTAAAISARNRSFRSIFILNLFFGWTLVGWFAAMVWAVRHGSIPERPSYRITPFGAVPDRGDEQRKAEA